MIGTNWPRPDSEPWVLGALCAQTDPDSFFPERGENTRDAKATCLRCDVRAECLDYALRNKERYGIWGGMTERPRRRLIDQYHQAATLDPDHDAA